jgi:hypothetical protein
MKTQIRTTPEAARRHRLAGMLLAALLALPAAKVFSDSGIPWQSLSKDEQSVLAKHRSDWSSLKPDQQQKLRNGARRYLQLPPDKRKAVERKHHQYENMSPKEREELRKKYSRQKGRD